jgi:hypothetical protein
MFSHCSPDARRNPEIEGGYRQATPGVERQSSGDRTMKRITRNIRNGQEQVWLNQDGHWTNKPEEAFEFEDADASKRLKRIPHATLEDIDKDLEQNSG